MVLVWFDSNNQLYMRNIYARYMDYNSVWHSQGSIYKKKGGRGKRGILVSLWPLSYGIHQRSDYVIPVHYTVTGSLYCRYAPLVVHIGFLLWSILIMVQDSKAWSDQPGNQGLS